MFRNVYKVLGLLLKSLFTNKRVSELLQFKVSYRIADVCICVYHLNYCFQFGTIGIVGFGNVFRVSSSVAVLCLCSRKLDEIVPCVSVEIFVRRVKVGSHFIAVEWHRAVPSSFIRSLNRTKISLWKAVWVLLSGGMRECWRQYFYWFRLTDQLCYNITFMSLILCRVRSYSLPNNWCIIIIINTACQTWS